MKPKSKRSLTAAIAAVAAFPSAAFAAQLFKDSTGTDINTLANWSTVNGATTPDPGSFGSGDQLRFNENTAASGSFTMDLSANLTVGDITVDSGTAGGGSATGNFVINSANNSTLTLNGGGNPSYTTSGIVLNSGTGGTLTINSNIALGATPVRFTTSRALTVNGDIALGANTLEFNTAGSTTTLAGIVSGTGGLNKAQGGSTLALTNTASTFSGQVTLVGGTTNVTKLDNIGNNSSLGTGNGASSIVLNGAVFTYTGAGGDTTNRAIDMRSTAVINNNSATGAITFTAANVIQGGTASARTLTLGGSNTGDNTFNSILGNSGTGANISSLQKNGGGNWIVTGTQTYTGATIINQGTLAISGSTVLGGASGSTTDAGNIVFGQNLNSGALQFETVANLGAADQIRYRNTGGTAGLGGALVYTGTTNQTLGKTLQSDSSIGIRIESNSVGGKLTVNGAISDNGARPIYLGGTGTGGNAFQTSLSGTRTVTKRGTGTWILEGTNTYTGATSVASGTLAINGTLGNTSTTIETTGTLQGSGSSTGSVTVKSGGTLAPGNSIESLGVGALSFEGGSSYAYELQTNLYGTTPGVAGDLTYSSSTLSITNGAILTLDDLATSTALLDGSKLTLISSIGAWNGGLFTYLGNTLADDSTFTLGANQWLFNYNDLTGGFNYTGDTTGATSFVTMTVVPEPEAALLGGIGMIILLRRRRHA